MATFSLFPSLLFLLTAALTTTTTTAQVTNFFCLGNTTNTPFSTNLQTALSTLSAASSASKSSNATTASSVQALYFCRHDLPLPTCHTCVSNATTYITRFCPDNTEAIIWYEHCTLRYAARPIIGHVDTSSSLSPYFWQWGGGKVFLQTPDYNRTLETTLRNVIDLASSSSNGSDRSYFATGEGVYSKYQKVRCLVQCSPDIGASECGKCLKEALNLTETHCLGASWGMVFKADCMLRFGIAPFYSEGNSSVHGGGAGAPAASVFGGLSSSAGSSSVSSSSSVMSCHSFGAGGKRVLLGMLLLLLCALLF